MEVFEMSVKVKLISFISAFVLVLGIMIIGVLSAEQVQVNIGGSVSFNATNVYAKVSGNISGAETGNKTFSTLTYSASETTGDESDWTNLALEFTETPDPIVITITVENRSTQRTLTVNLENTLQGEGLDIAVTSESDSYTSGTNVELPVSTGDGSSTTTFTLTLTVANPDKSLTDISFGYILNMYDESSVPVDYTEKGFNFFITGEDSVSLEHSDVSGTVITIPTTVSQDKATGHWMSGEDYKVTSMVDSVDLSTPIIGQTAEKIILPETLTYIGIGAFVGCSNLTSINIPDNVASIGDSAFMECSSLTSINIPESVASIGLAAFADCSSLESIAIPDSVTIIEPYAFDGCSSLQYNQDEYGVNYLGNEVNKYIYLANHGTLNGTSYTVKDGCKFINVGAFRACSSLTSITILDGVTSIGNYAFSDCSSLTSITIPDSVTIIKPYAFDGCSSLQYNQDEYGVNYLGNEVNKYIYLANHGTFDGTNYTIKETCKALGESALRDCHNLKTLVIPQGVTSISEEVFRNCYRLTSITIPDSVTSIENFAFQNCSDLPSITIPDSVTSIGSSAFHGCTGLSTITIPERVAFIYSLAFESCYSLGNVTVESDDIYLDLTSQSACEDLIYYVNDTGDTVKVLKSVVDSVDPDFTVNTYLNGSNFTRSVSEDGLYYVYTHI